MWHFSILIWTVSHVQSSEILDKPLVWSAFPLVFTHIASQDILSICIRKGYIILTTCDQHSYKWHEVEEPYSQTIRKYWKYLTL